MYLQMNRVPELIDRLILTLVQDTPANPRQHLKDQLHQLLEQRFERTLPPDSGCTPPFDPKGKMPCTRPVGTAKVITAELYAKLRQIRSSQGASLDDCLAEGLGYHQGFDPVGVQGAALRAMVGSHATSATAAAAVDEFLLHVSSSSPLQQQGESQPASAGAAGAAAVLPYGFRALDAGCFVAFQEAIEGLLLQRLAMRALPNVRSDLTTVRITSGFQFDEKYVLGIAVKMVRNVEGYRMMPAVTRAERRSLSAAIGRAAVAAFQTSGAAPGALHTAASTLFPPSQNRGASASTRSGTAAAGGQPSDDKATVISAATDPIALELRLLPTPSVQSPLSNKEWPDGRLSYISNDAVLFVNAMCGDEHVEVGVRAVRGPDARGAFERCVSSLQALQDSLKSAGVVGGGEWQTHPKYGPLPSNLDHFHAAGTIVYAVLRLPLLAHHPDLATVLEKQKLQRLTRLAPEGFEAGRAGDVVVVRSSPLEKPFLVTEAELVQQVSVALQKLVDTERLLLNGGSL